MSPEKETPVSLGASFEDGVLTIQRSGYISGGWYIENRGHLWLLFEIPEYGGEPQYVDSYDCFPHAYKAARELT